MTDVEVSIVVPTYNDDDRLRDCLESIENLEYPVDRRQTIIVDGHSDDDTVDIAREFGCEVVFEDGGTISHAREVGVEHADGEYVAFTDADCVVPADWLDVLLRPFEDETYEGKRIAAVGGPNVTPEDDTRLARAVGDVLVFLSEPGSRYGYSADEVQEIYHNPTCNVVYRRDVLLEVDGFNEDLVTVDDEELDYRIRRAGYVLLFSPSAEVRHYRRPSWRGFARMAYRYGYGRAQAIRLHRDLARWFHVAPSVALVAFGVVATGTLVVPAASVVAAGLLALGLAGVAALGASVGVRQRFAKTPVYTVLIGVWLLAWAVGFVAGTGSRR